MKTNKSTEHIRLHMIVTGVVQGIGYRWFVQRTARDLGLTGWVSNSPDGSVEIEAQGPRNALDGFLDSLRRDHPSARVSDVKVEQRAPEEAGTADFDIKF